MKPMFFRKQKIHCFLHDPMNFGNWIYGSSASLKSSLYIWMFSVHVLLKPSLKDFEYYLASMWNECNCAVVWTVFELPFFGIGMETDHLLSCGHCWVFHIGWHTECSTFTASSFRILNSSTGITRATSKSTEYIINTHRNSQHPYKLTVKN